MLIAVGSDHRGRELKNEILSHLAERGYSAIDGGPTDDSPVDYPDIAVDIAEGVSRGDYDFGILVCGTGIGMSIAANKVPGARAALCCDTFMAMRSRQHNDANILCLGADRPQPVADIVDTFLTIGFEGGRHIKRIEKLKDIEDIHQSHSA